MKTIVEKSCASVLPLFILCGLILLGGCKKEQAGGVPQAESAKSDVKEQIGGGRLAGISNLDEIYREAEEGDAACQLALGDALLNTATTESEKVEGVEWIRKAAEDEYYTPAHYLLAMCYLEGNGVERDDTEGMKWLQKGAKDGHYLSRYQIALCYIEGRGVEQNRDAGIEILRKLADVGFEDAEVKLAELGAE